MSIQNNKKGFTLIELLVVIGILAILFNSTIVAINPRAMFQNARDTQRLSDVAVIRSALFYYLSSSAQVNFQAGTGFTCGTHFGSSATGTVSPFNAGLIARAENFSVDGTGWVAVDFSALDAATVGHSLPRDPLNTSEYFYSYSCDQDNALFEINANLESEKHQSGGVPGTETTDGGDNPDFYEIGNATNL